jgi:hypothetical protein
MTRPIGVDCLFYPDGRIRLRRIKLGDQWVAVEQGRQWQDENGRHILIIIPGQEVQEILLNPDSLHWQLLPRQGGTPIL